MEKGVYTLHGSIHGSENEVAQTPKAGEKRQGAETREKDQPKPPGAEPFDTPTRYVAKFPSSAPIELDLRPTWRSRWTEQLLVHTQSLCDGLSQRWYGSALTYALSKGSSERRRQALKLVLNMSEMSKAIESVWGDCLGRDKIVHGKSLRQKDMLPDQQSKELVGKWLEIAAKNQCADKSRALAYSLADTLCKVSDYGQSTAGSAMQPDLVRFYEQIQVAKRDLVTASKTIDKLKADQMKRWQKDFRSQEVGSVLEPLEDTIFTEART